MPNFRSPAKEVWHGTVKNGVLQSTKMPDNKVTIAVRTWYALKIEVSVDKRVKIFVNGQLQQQFNAFFTTRGYGGVLIANVFNSLGEFRNYDVAPILSTTQ